ncbi:hypothetical protein Y032_0339g2957 [Ancylostoma ceylanicum]|uniref:Uncharacterized protein n=1 Tax=Ancylostoma ceylanicum TaxID=53326 RepID=A0A016RY71_9BILA|nr:hypothetical protein Y032_0339g2957 [Ancylostoma ceylanicum]
MRSQQLVLQGVPLEDASEKVNLGRLMNMENDIKPEIMRRMGAGKGACNSIESVLKHIKAESYDLSNSTVLPVLRYASETWALTRIAETQLHSAQISFERRILGLFLCQQREHHLHNWDVRAMSNP